MSFVYWNRLGITTMRHPISMISFFVFFSVINSFAQTTTVPFNYTGALQTWTVPSCITTITVTAEGAQGGGTNGGLGAIVTATLAITPGQVLQINVGGIGATTTPTAGWNGGGNGWVTTIAGQFSSGGGGGASDVRVVPYALANRVIVGAGGGGRNGYSSTYQAAGGAGGCVSGVAGAGSIFTVTGGGGGTQTSGGAGGPPWATGQPGQAGALALGGAGGQDATNGASGGGGGGGLYGGGGGGGDDCCAGANGGGAGGGGSSFPVGGCTPAANTGNGQIAIIYGAGGLTSTVASANPNCNGGTGNASVTVGGGNPAYTYLWSPSGGNSSAATGLSAGNYTISVTDAGGCTSTNTITITIPTALTSAVVSTTTVTCGATNGTATVSGSGGTGVITYSWNTTPPQTGPSANNLAAGNYVVTLTDANGCTTTQPVTITGSGNYTVTPMQTNILCFGSNNGSATVNTTGGTAPFTYAWSTNPVQTTSALSNIPAGNYTCTITDASGCTKTQTFTVTQPAALLATTSSTPTQCIANIGTATANPSGGTAPYTYAWTTTPVQNSQTATGLGVATFSVTITDANGCTKSYSVAITTQAPTLTATASVVNNVSCAPPSAPNGSTTASGSGGTPPYTYGWTPSGQTTPTATGLSAGTYSVMITDVNGCTKLSSVTITVPTQLSLSQSTTTASCGVSDGSATATAAGGTPAYTYTWLTSPAQNGQTITNIPMGTYQVLVTDANGCNVSMSVTVPGFGPPAANFISNPFDTVNLLDGIVSFYDGSVNAYIWSWNFDDPLSGTNNFSSLENPYHNYSDTGTYCITLVVTDPNGICRDTNTRCIYVEAPFTFFVPNAFTPNGDYFNEYFTAKGSYITDFSMWIFDRWGNLVWSCQTHGEPQLDAKCRWDGKVRRGGDQVQEDVYLWKVELTDANNKPHKYVGRITMVK